MRGVCFAWWVHLCNRGCEDNIDAVLFKLGQVGCFICGISRKVFVRSELGRVKEQRTDSYIADWANGVHVGSMSGMDSAESRHQRD